MSINADKHPKELRRHLKNRCRQAGWVAKGVLPETILEGGKPMEIRVDCYSGYRGEETPRRFRLDDREVEIREVLDRWLDPDHRYFKVKGDDGAIYILRYDAESDLWNLTFFQNV